MDGIIKVKIYRNLKSEKKLLPPKINDNWVVNVRTVEMNKQPSLETALSGRDLEYHAALNFLKFISGSIRQRLNGLKSRSVVASSVKYDPGESGPSENNNT